MKFKIRKGMKLILLGGLLTGVVNINEAGVAELTMLPGIGLKKAEAIQQYAAEHPFKSVDELVEVKGIGNKLLEKLKPLVSVSGPTTARWVQTPTQTSAIPTPKPMNPSAIAHP